MDWKIGISLIRAISSCHLRAFTDRHITFDILAAHTEGIDRNNSKSIDRILVIRLSRGDALLLARFSES